MNNPGNSLKDSSKNISSIDELFQRSKKIRNSKEYLELLNFVNKFRKYSPFNNFLIYLQNRSCTYFGTARDWQLKFERTVKEDARPMLILAPMTPVLLVYDLDDTEGKEMPDLLTEPYKTDGFIDDTFYWNLLDNCKEIQIEIRYVHLNTLHGGSIAVYSTKENPVIRINKDFNKTQAFATLTHELGHLFLGHLGEKPKEWANREHLDKSTRELEAESVSYMVCTRMGIGTKSDSYLSHHLTDENKINGISIDLIMKVAGKIEKMCLKRLKKK